MRTKKLIALFLSLAMFVALGACTPPGGETSQPPESETPESEPPESEAPENLAVEITASLRQDKMTQEEADAAPAETVTHSTACGDITGIQKDGYTEWRGIRYATAERFEAPVLVTGWDGTYGATAWGDRACQYYGFYNMADSNVSQFYIDESTIQWDAKYSEDCLNLNIWAPDGAEKCPVLVYIHGGSLMTGSNTDVSTDGEIYARNGIVTVAINYRLGPFHQVYGDGYTGYLALQDQVAALHWIRDNIGDYGGDGSRIIVMGESAGAVSVQNLLASPLVEDGLISGAIMMSGGGDLSALNSPTSPDVVEAEWNQVKEKLGVSTIDELKTVPAKDLYAAWMRSGATATPTVNGVSLTTNITTALANDTVQDVPVIIGMLQEDMWPYSLYNAATDYAAKRSGDGGQPVYLYYFDRQIDKTFGAFHGGDLYYMFGTLYRNVREMDDIDYRISGEMIAYVTNFVKTGDPNSEGLTAWEPATASSKLFMHFGDEADGMAAPDVSVLANNESTRSAFPYASSIKVNHHGKEAPIDHDEVLGKWRITGWIVPGQEGSETLIDYEAIFEFTETERLYWVDGELDNTRTYTWDGDYDMVCVAPDGDELVCTMYWGEDGCLLIEDPRYGIAYTCYRVKEDVDPSSLLGKWEILGWTVDADGSWAPLTAPQYYTFDGSTMEYDTGDGVMTSAYTVEDGGLVLADWEQTWPISWDSDGQLLLGDGRYGITYVCRLTAGQ